MFRVCDFCGANLDPGERCDCEKVDVEWARTSYRQAKDPEEQVKILADLYLVSKETIKKVLGDLYGTVQKKKRISKKENNAEKRARLQALLISDIACGMTVREAAEHRGVPYNIASNYTREFRKELKKVKVRHDLLEELA